MTKDDRASWHIAKIVVGTIQNSRVNCTIKEHFSFFLNKWNVLIFFSSLEGLLYKINPMSSEGENERTWQFCFNYKHFLNSFLFWRVTKLTNFKTQHKLSTEISLMLLAILLECFFQICSCLNVQLSNWKIRIWVYYRYYCLLNILVVNYLKK